MQWNAGVVRNERKKSLKVTYRGLIKHRVVRLVVNNTHYIILFF